MTWNEFVLVGDELQGADGCSTNLNIKSNR